MTTSPTLLALLNCKADLNYYTSQQIYWTNLYDSNAQKLKKMQKYEDAWNNAYDKAYAAESDLKIGGQTYITKEEDYGDKRKATNYANAKCPEFVGKQDILDDLEDLDMEYDTMKTMYDALMEEKQAEYDSLKEKVSTEASDTHLLGS